MRRSDEESRLPMKKFFSMHNEIPLFFERPLHPAHCGSE